MIALNDAFRLAMRRMASTVSIVTLCDDGVPLGMAATAVSSLTADPPTLLVCINQSASMHAAFERADRFAVNMLHRDQQDHVRLFSDSSLREQRFETAGWRLDASCPPILDRAQASFVCEKADTHRHHTHSIFIGTVQAVEVRDEAKPLIYIDGGYLA